MKRRLLHLLSGPSDARLELSSRAPLREKQVAGGEKRRGGGQKNTRLILPLALNAGLVKQNRRVNPHLASLLQSPQTSHRVPKED